MRDLVGHVPVYLVRGVGEEGALLQGGIAGEDVVTGGQGWDPVVRPVIGRLEIVPGCLPLSLLPFHLQLAQKAPVSWGAWKEKNKLSYLLVINIRRQTFRDDVCKITTTVAPLGSAVGGGSAGRTECNIKRG